MTIATVCRCGTVLLAGSGPMCAQCRRDDNRRRNQKSKRHGLHSTWWPKLRARVLARDGHQCRQCGATDNLSVDYQRGGVHSRNMDDYITLCLPCHGQKDGPRSSPHISETRIGIASEKNGSGYDEPRMLG